MARRNPWSPIVYGALCATVLGVCLDCPPARGENLKLEDALQLSRKTGRPLLAVAGTET